MNERFSTFICPSWQWFECLGMAQSACHWRVAFVRQQIVQTRLFAQNAAPDLTVTLKFDQLASPQNLMHASTSQSAPMLRVWKVVFANTQDITVIWQHWTAGVHEQPENTLMPPATLRWRKHKTINSTQSTQNNGSVFFCFLHECAYHVRQSHEWMWMWMWILNLYSAITWSISIALSTLVFREKYSFQTTPIKLLLQSDGLR